MTRYKQKPETGMYSALRTRFGNLLVGRRQGKSTIRVAKDLKATSNLFKHTKKAKKFRSSEKRAWESEVKKS